MGGKAKDWTGRKFGILTAAKPIRQDKSQSWHWQFDCDCGGSIVAAPRHVEMGSIVGCKNFYRARFSARSAKNATTHGMSKEPIYAAWNVMKARCNNPTSRKWPYYGARGIKVCERWNSFENFYADMGDRPEGLTLGRIDNDGDYEPSNCRWETHYQQVHNRRPNGTALLGG